MNRIIRASEIVADMRAGMNGAELMSKYGLSSSDLKNVYQQIELERETRLKQVLRDLLRGSSHAAIMKKHRISSGALDRILRTASALPAASQANSGNLDHEICDEVSIDCRTEPRYKPLGLISAWDHQGKVGDCFLGDISERGLCLLGAQAQVNQPCDVSVLGDDFGFVSPFRFRAECRWRSTVGKLGQTRAGFSITSISPGNLAKLCEFIENHTNGRASRKPAGITGRAERT